MHGIICIDKPEGFTSFDVVAKMRGIARTSKIGHAGTLDPMATGVLPLFFGKATKCCDILPNQDKRYTVQLQFGVTTDTQDTTGQILASNDAPVKEEDFIEALERFRGPVEQLPPMYSAVKVGGRRLYELARKGLVVERRPRSVQVYHIEVLAFDAGRRTTCLDIACSKGTYVRTICHDLGQMLGCGAAMSGLRRTEAAGYSLDECISLEKAQQLADAGILGSALLPMASAFADLPAVRLTERQSRFFRNGVTIRQENLPLIVPEKNVAVFGPDDVFLGLGRLDRDEGVLIIVKNLALEQA